MSHYVVTTTQHRDVLRGDCLEDCFCCRAVAELRFESYIEAGQKMVRLIRWTDGEPSLIARHEVLQPEPEQPASVKQVPCALPLNPAAVLGWVVANGWLRSATTHKPRLTA